MCFYIENFMETNKIIFKQFQLFNMSQWCDGDILNLNR